MPLGSVDSSRAWEKKQARRQPRSLEYTLDHLSKVISDQPQTVQIKEAYLLAAKFDHAIICWLRDRCSDVRSVSRGLWVWLPPDDEL